MNNVQLNCTTAKDQSQGNFAKFLEALSEVDLSAPVSLLEVYLKHIPPLFYVPIAFEYVEDKGKVAKHPKISWKIETHPPFEKNQVLETPQE